MARNKGDKNKKPSKFFIPDGIKAKFGDWTFIENVQFEGNPRFFYRVRCSCGYETVKPAKRVINGTNRKCRKCYENSIRMTAKEKRIGAAVRVLEREGYVVNLAIKT